MSSIQVQSAELNVSNNHWRSAQVVMDEPGMSEQYPPQDFQPAAYYDFNDSIQRESLARSLAQNPNMLNDFYQFLEFTRVRNAQQPFQQIGVQQQIPSILDIKTNLQQKSSTPKRNRTMNESGGSISTAPKQLKQSGRTDVQVNLAPTTINHQRKSLPFEQLKRAVSSNLPCFFIDFEPSSNDLRLPSAFEARNLIENHLKVHNIRIRTFYLGGMGE